MRSENEEDAKFKAGCVAFIVGVPLCIFLAIRLIKYTDLADNIGNIISLFVIFFVLIWFIFRPILKNLYTTKENEAYNGVESPPPVAPATIDRFKQNFYDVPDYEEVAPSLSSNMDSPEEESQRYYYEYYQYCQRIADKILEFITKVSKDKVFFQECNKIVIDGLEADTFGPYNPTVAYLVMHDICRCYENMGYKEEKGGRVNLLYGLALLRMNRNDDGQIWINSNEYRGAIYNLGRSCRMDTVRFIKTTTTEDGGEKKEEIDTTIYYIYNKLDRNSSDYTKLLYEVSLCVASHRKQVSKKALEFINKLKGSEKMVNEIYSKPHGLSDLDQLIGLNGVKDEVKKLSSFVQVQQWRAKEGLKSPTVSYHCVFTGNPGTGKTTVARIIADIYKELGILKKGHLVETDRSGLIAEYVGQTAVKTNKIIDKALDGVLFIDEAYSLVTGDSSDFGPEAISTLLKRMEDDRDRLVVILAGYGEEMKHFINANPGLRSRFNRFFHFTDYTPAELMQIFSLILEKHDYILDGEDVVKGVEGIIEKTVATGDPKFGNARYVRNLFEKILENQAMRLAANGRIDRDSLQRITVEDLKGLE